MNATRSLEMGRRAAFHGAPVVGIAPLQALLATPGASQLGDEARWLLAVCQGASGLYGSALATLEPLWDESEFADRAHLVAGSIHRQLGHFDDAQHHDQRAQSSPRASVRCEATIGLAADAVGVGEMPAAAAYLGRARELWQAEWWREGVRLQWVHAETMLLAGRAGEAIPGLRDALEAAQINDAPRHLAKTRGFLAVAIRSAAPGDQQVRGESPALLAQAADSAQALAAWPLVWVFRRLQWQWLDEANHTSPSPTLVRAQAMRAVSLIASDLPAHWRPAFRRRPDVADLIS